ncbi:hypothetical protein [uncultured Methanomethylovorans sp.]|nr:hypothetical protein [uncultured Methanomethylovorans sp.]
MIDTTKIHVTPSGTEEMVTIELSGQEFMLLSAGSKTILEFHGR